MKKVIFMALLLTMVGFFALAQAPAQDKPAEAPKADAKEVDAGPAPAVPPELAGKTRFEGIIINMQGMAAGATYFAVDMDQWSSTDEIKDLKTTLANEGQDAVLKKVWKAKQIGYLKIRNSMGKPIHFARAIPIPGGYIVRLLADTPISHVGMRSDDYPFCFIEMVVPTDGKKGHGTFIGMAQFNMDPSGQVQVSAYGTLPVRMEEIVIEKPKK